MTRGALDDAFDDDDEAAEIESFEEEVTRDVPMAKEPAAEKVRWINERLEIVLPRPLR
jgi:hypothetical protein